jgi:hypothetical protein
MLKISRIRPCEYNKSCSIFHHEFNKVYFAIFCIFYEFLHILQVSAKGVSLLKIHLSTGSLDFLIPYNHTLTFSSQVPALLQSVHRGPRGARGLTAGEGLPVPANKHY